MDDLISRKAAVEYFMTNMGWYDVDGYEVDDADKIRTCIEDLINGIPSVLAVPLDKLCEWLAGNAWHLDCSDCDAEHCDCPQLYDDSGGSPAFWKAKLTKWMKECNPSKN